MCKPYSTCRHIYCDQNLLNLKYQENMFLVIMVVSQHLMVHHKIYKTSGKLMKVLSY